MWGQFSFDFIGRKWLWFAISGSIMVVGLASFFTRGLQFGIEFRGGTVFDVTFERQVSAGEVRSALQPLGLAGGVIQPAGKTEMLIRMRGLSKDEQAKVKSVLEKKFGVRAYNYVQTVGPGWGKNITDAALKALLLSLVAILLYVSFRFEFKMAVAAVLALFHDLVITAGIYSLVGREVTPYTVAAILTILGYSLYDTIVVFDRVRENSARLVKKTYSQMVNESVNQVLARSINTNVSALLPVVALIALGSETLRDFAFALFVGMASSSYSSIFFASPILAAWKEIEPRYRTLREKYGTESAS